MTRRGTVNRKRAKTQHRKPTRSKRRSAPIAARRTPSVVDLQQQVGALTRELAEAREQQIATFEVLCVISSSPGELQAVFHAVLENAIRLCDAKFGTLFLHEANLFPAHGSSSVLLAR